VPKKHIVSGLPNLPKTGIMPDSILQSTVISSFKYCRIHLNFRNFN